MKFLKGIWNGIKKGFSFIKKHRTLAFLVGGTILGTALGVYLGFPLLGSLAAAAAVTGGAALLGGGVILVGGLVLLAAVGIGQLFGIGKKKHEPEPTPVVSPAEPGDGATPTPITDLPPARGDGIIKPLTGQGAAGNGLPITVTDRRAQLPARNQTGAQGPRALGFQAALESETPAPIDDVASVDADEEEAPPEAMQLPTPVSDGPGHVAPVVDLPLGSVK